MATTSSRRSASAPERLEQKLRVLVVEDNPADAELMVEELRRAGYEVGAHVVSDPESFRARLQENSYHAILSDYNLASWNGMDALRETVRQGKDIPFLLVTGTLGDETAVECMKQGAADYVLKDRLARLPAAIEVTLREKELREERRRAEADNQLLLVALEQAAEGILFTDTEGRIRYANPAFSWFTGYNREEVLGKNPRFLKSGHHDQRFYQEMWETILAGKVWHGEMVNRRKDGRLYFEEMSVTPVRTKNQTITHFIAVKQDVTERKRAERALRVLSAANEVLVRAVDEQALLREICRVVVDGGGYRMAWIGVKENDERKSVRPVARGGVDGGYLEKADVSWSEQDQRGRGPVGTAIRNRRPVVVRDVETDPAFAPWKEEAVKRGFGSVIALPLPFDHELFGALAIYAGEPEAFDPNERKLLGEMAADLAYGIQALRTHAARAQAEAALRESAERLRLALQASNTGTWYWDIPANRVLWDDYLHYIFGVPPGTFRGGREEFLARVHPDDRERAAEEIRRCVEEGADYNSEFRITWPDGSLHHLAASGRAFADGEGQPVRMTGVCTDMTERKRAEAALRESERTLSTLMSNLPGMAYRCLMDANWTMEFVSEGCRELTGYEPAALTHNRDVSYEEIIHPGDREDVRQAVTRALEDQKPFEMNYRIRTAARQEKWVWERGRAVDPEGGTPFLEGFITDISERIRAEGALRQSREALEALVQSSPVAIVALDPEGRVQEWNPAAEHIFGWPFEEVRGEPFPIVPPGEEEDFYGLLSLVLEGGGIANVERRRQRKNGEMIDISISASPLRDPQGTINGVMGVMLDITERKRAEEQRIRSLELQAENEALARLDQMKSEFLANMSHELRTPLNAVLGFSELLLETSHHLPPKEREDLEIIHRKAGHLLALVSDLLDLSRIEAGKVEIEQTTVPARDALLSIQDSFFLRLRDKGLEGKVEVDPPDLAVCADPHRLEQILTNLVSNALRFTVEGGITLRAQKQDQEVLFCVEDTGSGISPEDVGRVFDKFYQAHRQAEGARQGTGLGLAITKQLVELQGGRIWVESTVGEGTRFFFTLPLPPPPGQVHD